MLLSLHGAPPFAASAPVVEKAPAALLADVGADSTTQPGSPWSVVSSRRSRISISEVDASALDVADISAAVGRVTLPPDEDDGRASDCAPDERSARKAKGKKRRDRAGAARRLSARLAGKEAAEHVTVESRAIKRRGLRDSLFGCSPKLRAKVLKSKALDAVRKPMSSMTVADLRAAAAIPSAQVPAVVDA
jgi:hypothetical protein